MAQIRSIRLKKFRRFEDLTISDLPPARLVIMAGPNGVGKSSLFDAFSVWRQQNSGLGLSWDAKYHSRVGVDHPRSNEVGIDFFSPPAPKTAFYVRSAYRNDPAFSHSGLSLQAAPEDDRRALRMIDTDPTVSQNYQRLASQAFSDVFKGMDGGTTIGEFRENVIGDLSASVQRLFPDLILNTLGDPMNDGTFRFDKGHASGFSYMNLSGGEKAAFDLILDLIVKRRSFVDTVYAIDEPEAHMNTRLQGVLLEELVNLIPVGAQLWIATHSIGMMRKARELYGTNPEDVVFLDFDGWDFDQPVTLTPQRPNRAFWERILSVALDDLSELVGPSEVVLCEGNPSVAGPALNDNHDARCYEAIFSDAFPEVKFISVGSTKEVQGDRLRVAAILPKLVTGIAVRRLVDRDDHSPEQVTDLNNKGIRVLSRRNIEAYLYDDEVLLALYERHDRGGDVAGAIDKRAASLADSILRGNPSDDLKSASGDLIQFLKRDLNLTGCGSDPASFARAVLVPLIKPEMAVYNVLRADIFG